jgi:hypothetical protein
MLSLSVEAGTVGRKCLPTGALLECSAPPSCLAEDLPPRPPSPHWLAYLSWVGSVRPEDAERSMEAALRWTPAPRA